MKRSSILFGTFAILALGTLYAAQVQAESIKEDTKCCMPGTAFCLAEKTGSDTTYFLSEEAKKDLALTDEQVTKIRELVKKTHEEIQKDCKHLERPKNESSKKECAAFRQEMKKVCEKYYPKCSEELKKILKPAQIEKFQTRIFQYYGFAPCPIALSILELNEQQKKEVLDICEQTCEKIHEACHENTQTQTKEQLHAKILKCRQECSEKVKSLLTKEQISKGERLLNEVPAYVQKMKSEHEQARTASRNQSMNF